MQVKVNKNKIEVYSDKDILLKEVDISKDEYRDYMVELSSSRLEFVRACHKLFKPSYTKFKGISK